MTPPRIAPSSEELLAKELARKSVILRKYLDPSAASALYVGHRHGDVVQLHRGAYVQSKQWLALGFDAQHRAKAQAIAAHFGDEFVFSHLTAAALWRLPRMGQWPAKPHVAGPRGSGGSVAAFTRHGLGLPSVVETIDGLRTTTLARTVTDIAATVGFAHAVVIADAALRRTTHQFTGLPHSTVNVDHLRSELETLSLRHGAVKARRAIEFADGKSDRPGESMSRVSMHLAGLSAPELQVRLAGASGAEYVVDFWWPKFNIIGEFDGKYKYTDPEFLRGRTPQQVLYDEKLREDDLRAAGHGFSRWPWAVAVSPTLLGARVRAAGVA